MPTVAGLAVFVFMIPLQSRVVSRVGSNLREMLSSTDERIKLETEVFAGMRVIKVSIDMNVYLAS